MRPCFARSFGVNDIRWFAPNRYTSLLVPELRRRGLRIALEGNEPARLVLAMSGTRSEEAWRYARTRNSRLVVYIWDLPPRATTSGAYDPVWSVGGFLIRLPRPIGGFGRRRGYYSRLRHVAARAHEIWVPSAMTRELVQERFGLESRRVPYCYDSERFFPSPGHRDDPPTLLTVSRLKAHKNQAATIKAAARLGGMVQVRLIGRGPERESLSQLALSLGVQCRIESDVSDAEVVDAYRRASVTVCPSRFEGFGLTPLEAIASGTPVVASDIPPHREFVAGTAGLFAPEDEDALTNAVAAALRQAAPDAAAIGTLTIPAAAERFLGCVTPLLQ
jgi:glycosyltransferase involved in cell wall biosynthesis